MKTSLTLLALLATAIPLTAGSPAPVAPFSPAPAKFSGPPANEIEFRTSYTGRGDFKEGRGTYGETDGFTIEAKVSHRLALSTDSSLTVGLDYKRISFGGDSGLAPIPSQTQSISLPLTLSWKESQTGPPGFIVAVQPGFYFTDEADTDDFNIPVLALANFRVTDWLYASVGFVYDGFSENPILPIAGFTAGLSKNLLFALGMPRTGFAWSPSDALTLTLGADVNSENVRTDSSDADRTGSRHRKAVLSYTEFRLGLGATFRPAPGLELGIDAGYSIGRNFYYHRIGDRLRVDNAPTVQMSVKLNF